MKIFKTIFIGSLLVVMFFYYYHYELKRINDIKVQAEESKKIFSGFKKENVQKLSLHGDKEELLLKKEGGTWLLKAPVEARADQEAVASLVEDLVGLKREGMTVKNPKSYREFGLDTPKLKINFATPKGEESLWIGDHNPSNTLVYGRKASEPRLFAFPTHLEDSLVKNSFNLRDKTILPIQRNKLKRISISRGEVSLDLSNSKEKGWEVSSPYQWRADKGKVEGIIKAVVDSKVKAFVDEKLENLEEYGLESPLAELTFFSGEEGESGETLLIGKEEKDTDRVYAKSKNSANVFSIDSELLKSIPITVEEFRDKKLFAVQNEDRVLKMRFSGKENLLVEKNEKGGWELLEPKKLKADLFETNFWAGNVANIQVKEFLDDTSKDSPEYGLATPIISIEFWEKDVKQSQTILIGKEVSGSKDRYIALAASPGAYTISEETFKNIQVSLMKLRDKRLTSFDAEAMESIEIQKGKQNVRLEKSGEDWTVNPSGKKLEGNKVRNFLWDVTDLAFQDTVTEGETDKAKLALGRPALSVKLFKAKKEKVSDILFSHEIKNKENEKEESSDPLYYAKTKNQSEILKVQTAFVEEMDETLKKWGLTQY